MKDCLILIVVLRLYFLLFQNTLEKDVDAIEVSVSATIITVFLYSKLAEKLKLLRQENTTH